MTTRNVTAWVPIRTPAFDHPDRLPVYESCRNQFIRQLPQVLCALGPDLAVEEAKLDEPPAAVMNWLKQKNFMAGTRLFEYISVTANVSVDEAWLNANPGIEEMYLLGEAAGQLGDRLELVLALTELAYPGCVNTTEGALVSAGLLINEIPKKSTYSQLFPESDNSIWPPIDVIEIATIVNWAQRTSFVEKHLAETRVERSLAAYSHVVGLTWLRSGEGLFRAMQGLEAFYSDGIGDLRKQLSEKIQLWLGVWTDNKNVVGHLYDLRSAFVHGSARLVYWNHDSGAWDEDESGMERFSSGVDFAIRLLIATLQRCAKEGVVDIKWSYGFTTSTSPMGS